MRLWGLLKLLKLQKIISFGGLATLFAISACQVSPNSLEALKGAGSLSSTSGSPCPIDKTVYEVSGQIVGAPAFAEKIVLLSSKLESYEQNDPLVLQYNPSTKIFSGTVKASQLVSFLAVHEETVVAKSKSSYMLNAYADSPVPYEPTGECTWKLQVTVDMEAL